MSPVCLYRLTTSTSLSTLLNVSLKAQARFFSTHRSVRQHRVGAVAVVLTGARGHGFADIRRQLHTDALTEIQCVSRRRMHDAQSKLERVDRRT